MIMTDYRITQRIDAVRIIEDSSLVETVEDWSKVRSPSRARRRLKRGFPQNIVLRQVPKREGYYIDGGRTLVIHPEIAREVERMLAAQMKGLTEEIMLGATPLKF